MQLDDVRERLHELAARVPEGAVGIDQAYRSARRTASRRRATKVGTALVIAVLIGTLGVVLNASRPAPVRRVDVAGPTTTTRPAVPFTAEQLNAHDGVGVPKGWLPVDAGNARVWLPHQWDLESAGVCVYDQRSAGLVSIGKMPSAGCGSRGEVLIPARSMALIPKASTPFGPVLRTVHGYRVYAPNMGKAGVPWRVYDVPQLEIQIVFRGDIGSQILDTLGPSAREVALAYAAQPAPKTNRPVAGVGVTLAIPQEWRPGSGSSCGRFVNPPGLLIVPAHHGPVSCPASVVTVPNAVHDGVVLFASYDEFGPEPAPALAVFHHGDTTVKVYEERGYQDALEVEVRRAGSSVTHDVLLGLGRDGRVAGGVLASIRATK